MPDLTVEWLHADGRDRAEAGAAEEDDNNNHLSKDDREICEAELAGRTGDTESERELD